MWTPGFRGAIVGVSGAGGKARNRLLMNLLKHWIPSLFPDFAISTLAGARLQPARTNVMSLGTSLEDDPILKQSKQYTSQLNEVRFLGGRCAHAPL